MKPTSSTGYIYICTEKITRGCLAAIFFPNDKEHGMVDTLADFTIFFKLTINIILTICVCERVNNYLLSFCKSFVAAGLAYQHGVLCCVHVFLCHILLDMFEIFTLTQLYNLTLNIPSRQNHTCSY